MTTYNSGLTSVTGNVAVSASSNFPAPSAAQTCKVYTYRNSSEDSAQAFVVTGGKTFYCTSMYIHALCGGNQIITIYDNTSAAGTINGISSMSANAAGTRGECHTYPVPVKYVNGAWFSTTTNCDITFEFVGYEV